jgi:hypothetical protein
VSRGIYRARTQVEGLAPPLLPEEPPQKPVADQVLTEELLHHKYHLPARCFAYVANAADAGTWKLPYLVKDGSVDAKRLPKAIQSILTNYRGAKVGAVSEAAIPDVLVRLAQAAARIGKFPTRADSSALVYRQLTIALEHLGRLHEVRTGSDRA